MLPCSSTSINGRNVDRGSWNGDAFARRLDHITRPDKSETRIRASFPRCFCLSLEERGHGQARSADGRSTRSTEGRGRGLQQCSTRRLRRASLKSCGTSVRLDHPRRGTGHCLDARHVEYVRLLLLRATRFAAMQRQPVTDRRASDAAADARLGSSQRKELVARFKRFGIEQMEAGLEGDFGDSRRVCRVNDDRPLQQRAFDYVARWLAGETARGSQVL